MEIHLKHLLAPPAFPDDEDRTRAAQTLHWLLLSCLVPPALACALVFVVYTSHVIGLLLALAFFLPLLIALGLTRRGHVRAASRVTVVGIWLIVTLYLTVSGGMTSAAMVFYLVCTLFAGLLLGSRTALVVAALSSLTGLGMVFLSAAGYFPPPLFPMLPQSGWLDMTFSLYIIIVTLNLALKNLHKALASAQQQLAHRQQAEEALRESERKFRDIARNLPGIVFQYRFLPDGSGRFTYLSPRASEIFGLPVDLEGRRAWEEMSERIHPDDSATFLHSVDEALARRADWRYEGRVVLPEGGFTWFQGIASPTPAGDELVYDGILLNITQRKQAEVALSESNERYRTLFETANDGLYILDGGIHIECNQKAVELYGCRGESELIGRTALDFSPAQQPDGQASAAKAEAYIRAVLGGAPQYFYWRLQRPDRTQIDAEVSLNPLNLNGRTYLLAAVRDITERRRAEENLRQSEEKYRSIFENAFEGISQSTPQGRFLSVNPALVKMYGYGSAEEMIHAVTDIGRQLYARPEDREQIIGRLAQAGSVENYEAECLRKDGQPIWVSLNMHAVRDAEGAVRYYEGAALDITARREMQQNLTGLVKELSNTVARLEEEIAERKRAEATIQAQSSQLQAQNEALLALGETLAEAARETGQLNEELEQRVIERTAELNRTNAELARAVRAKDGFLATMSHELRSPLNTILVTNEALAEGLYGELSSPQQIPLRAIAESGQHLLALINDILDLAKFEAGKVTLALAPVPVEEVCQAALRLIRESAVKKQLSLVTRFDPKVRLINADERRLKQILVNLLANAVKFTPEGGELGLAVCGLEAAQTVSFTVWDSGVGIAPEDLGKLFQPFVQLDNRLARQYTGTGLGLSLVKDMVELHGGSVSVESTQNQGSRFTLLLPWSQTLAAAQPASKIEAPQPHDGQGQFILLAEDSELVISPVVAFLQTHGYRVTVARDGQEAIERARTLRPALILMDVQMPHMDGLEATRQIRTEAGLSDVPIIAVSALAMPGDRERCLAAGVTDYLSKPVSLKQIATTIEKYTPPLHESPMG